MILRIKDVTCVAITVPCTPTLGVDSVRKAGLLEYDARVGTPGPAEIVRPRFYGIALCDINCGFIDDVVRRVIVGVAPVCCDIAGACGDELDVDVVKPGPCSLAKDKVTEQNA